MDMEREGDARVNGSSDTCERSEHVETKLVDVTAEISTEMFLFL